MRRTTLSGVLAVAAMLFGCQTITEEMPNAPTGGPSGSNPPSVPVVVVPIPIPTPPPATPPPVAPPVNNPPSNPSDPGHGDIPNNTNPVAKLTAKIFFVECFGQIVPYPPAPVGCRVHLDVTPTDSANRHTRANGTPQWTYTNRHLFTLSGNSAYNPVLDVKAGGDVDCYAEVDGIRSNTVHVEIR